MNFALLSLFLLCSMAFCAHAAPKPRPVKVVFLRGDDDARVEQIPVTAVDNDEHLFAEHRQSNTHVIDDYHNDDDDDDDDDDIIIKGSAEAKASDTSARLFIQRFMRLKNNLFGNKRQRYIIQIYPNGTSSITTVPTANVAVPITNIASPSGVFRNSNDDDYADVDSVQDVIGTINTQRNGAKQDQNIIVRIPAEYKHLFNNGQQVVLSTNNGINKKRVANKKRVNKNRKSSNKNNNYNMKNQYLQRTRIVMA